MTSSKKMSKKSLKHQWTSKIANNFSKNFLIFAFSTILAENKYIFTYLIRISMQIVKNKYTYWKKVFRRHPEEDCEKEARNNFILPCLAFHSCVGTKSVLISRLDWVKGCSEKEDDSKINFPPINLISTMNFSSVYVRAGAIWQAFRAQQA